MESSSDGYTYRQRMITTETGCKVYSDNKFKGCFEKNGEYKWDNFGNVSGWNNKPTYSKESSCLAMNNSQNGSAKCYAISSTSGITGFYYSDTKRKSSDIETSLSQENCNKIISGQYCFKDRYNSNNYYWNKNHAIISSYDYVPEAKTINECRLLSPNKKLVGE